MILYGRIGQSDVRPHLQPPYKRPLLTIENFARLNEWIERGEVDIQVWLVGLGHRSRGCNSATQYRGTPMQDQICVSLQDLVSPQSRRSDQQAALSVWLRSRCDDQGRAKSRPPERRSHLISS